MSITQVIIISCFVGENDFIFFFRIRFYTLKNNIIMLSYNLLICEILNISGSMENTNFRYTSKF